MQGTYNTRGCTVKRWGNRQRRNNAAALDTRQLCTGNATVAGDCFQDVQHRQGWVFKETEERGTLLLPESCICK